MEGGKFTGAVTNYGTITSGAYTGTVTNENTGVISGGDFTEGTLVNNGGTVPEKPKLEEPKKDDDKSDEEESVYVLTVKNAEVTVKDADGKAVEIAKAPACWAPLP